VSHITHTPRGRSKQSANEVSLKFPPAHTHTHTIYVYIDGISDDRVWE